MFDLTGLRIEPQSFRADSEVFYRIASCPASCIPAYAVFFRSTKTIDFPDKRTFLHHFFCSHGTPIFAMLTLGTLLDKRIKLLRSWADLQKSPKLLGSPLTSARPKYGAWLMSIYQCSRLFEDIRYVTN